MDHSARDLHLDLHRLSQILEQVPRRDDLRAVPQVLLEPYLAVVNRTRFQDSRISVKIGSNLEHLRDSAGDSCLSTTDFAQLRRWFSELDCEQCDSQFEADAESGALEFLVVEARDAKANNALKEL